MDSDPQQQNREWAVQRVAWKLLTALLIAIALGLFGRGGLLSKTAAISKDGTFQIEYDRFLRYHSPDSLQVNIAKTLSGSVRLKMDSQYARQIQIEHITPEPQRVIGEGDAITYIFNVQPEAAVFATFHFLPEKYGKLEGWISVGEGPRLPLSHFVYP